MLTLSTFKNAKLDKSLRYGYLTAGLALEPHYKRNGVTTCPAAGLCAKTCLSKTGRNRFDGPAAARARRTALLIDKPVQFRALLEAEIEVHSATARALALLPAYRFNLTSDIDFNAMFPGIIERHPEVQFYDYTRVWERLFMRQPENYHLTYSINETTPPGLVDRIYARTRFNCAAIYSAELPATWATFDTLDGDISDLRFLDDRPAIVMLRYKMAFSAKTHKAVNPSPRLFQIGA